MDTKFANKIYETPDNWGEVEIADEKTMDTVIESLHELGEDWENCSIDECTEYEFVRDLGNGTALYEGRYHTDSYSTNGRLHGMVFSHHNVDGFYTLVQAYDTVQEHDRQNEGA